MKCGPGLADTAATVTLADTAATVTLADTAATVTLADTAATVTLHSTHLALRHTIGLSYEKSAPEIS